MLTVGTRHAPPFAIKGDDGSWRGLSIELWDKIAGKLNLQFRLVDVETVPGLLEGLQDGRLDVAVAAITVTADREQRVDFTVPYYQSGAGVVVPSNQLASWAPVIGSIASYGFLQAIAALLGLALLAGLLIWLFERRSNEAFSGGLTRGVSSGLWWSTNAMTQRMGGGVIPMTLPGRLIAVIWMVVSVIAIAVFTAGLTSALTTKRLHGAVHSVTDLSRVRVGTLQGAATEDALTRMRIDHVSFPSVKDGLDALQSGRIEAFAHDRPILAWQIRNGGLPFELSDLNFDPQSYAIALRNNSALRKQINVALLEAEQSDWWKEVTFRYLGQTIN
jgi:ABC-type amino acid transport substrate-binding protein